MPERLQDTWDKPRRYHKSSRRRAANGSKWVFMSLASVCKVLLLRRGTAQAMWGKCAHGDAPYQLETVATREGSTYGIGDSAPPSSHAVHSTPPTPTHLSVPLLRFVWHGSALGIQDTITSGSPRETPASLPTRYDEGHWQRSVPARAKSAIQPSTASIPGIHPQLCAPCAWPKVDRVLLNRIFRSRRRPAAAGTHVGVRKKLRSPSRFASRHSQ